MADDRLDSAGVCLRSQRCADSKAPEDHRLQDNCPTAAWGNQGRERPWQAQRLISGYRSWPRPERQQVDHAYRLLNKIGLDGVREDGQVLPRFVHGPGSIGIEADLELRIGSPYSCQQAQLILEGCTGADLELHREKTLCYVPPYFGDHVLADGPDARSIYAGQYDQGTYGDRLHGPKRREDSGKTNVKCFRLLSRGQVE
jgi:hypothetical protein